MSYTLFYKHNIFLDSSINEVITAVLNFFKFLRKHFTHAKSTKSTKRYKDTQAKAQKRK